MPHKTIDGITSSIIPFYLSDGACTVLLGQRGPNSKAFPNAWCLVGGFLDPGSETLQQCAARELHEETGLVIAPHRMNLVILQSDPKRDPRGQIIDTVWSCRLDHQLPATAADDLQALAWHPLAEALTLDLAFDHHDSLQHFATAQNLSKEPA